MVRPTDNGAFEPSLCQPTDGEYFDVVDVLDAGQEDDVGA
jgi:hypothetical protein